MNNNAFIDGNNLKLGISKDLYNRNNRKVYLGWELDYKKFRIYLHDKFRVTKAFLFIGYVEQNKEMYSRLKSYGYELVFKPTVKDGSGKPKGNVDSELVLYAAAIEFANYDKAIIVSGDGDFFCLHKFLEQNNKLLKIVIPNSKSVSSLLKSFQKYKIFLKHDRNKLEKNKNGRRRL